MGATGVIGALVRGDLRSRWRSVVVLAVLLGVGLGGAAALAGGARRTSSVYDRVARETHAYDVLVNPDDGDTNFAAVETQPEVAASTRVSGVLLFPENADPSQPYNVVVYGFSPTNPSGAPAPAAEMREGRWLDPAKPDEMVANPTAANQYGWHVGEVVQMHVPNPDEAQRMLNGEQVVLGRLVPMRIVGIGVQSDNALVGAANLVPELYTGPATLAELQPTRVFSGSLIRLRPGVDVGAFVHRAQELLGEPVFFRTRLANEAAADQAVLPYVAALTAGAALLAIAVVLIMGQAIARATSAAAADDSALAALGVARRTRVARHLVRAALVGIAGGAVGVVVAYALSGAFPLGPARAAEPAPGLRFDAAVAVGAFFACVLTAVVATAVNALVNSTRRVVRAGRPSRATEAATRVGFGPAAVTGVRAATQAGGRGGLPVRTTIATATLGVIAIVTAAAFGASIHRLVDSPRLFGGRWDLTVEYEGSGGSDSQSAEFRALMDKALAGAAVQSRATVAHVPVVVGGQSSAGIALEPTGPYPSIVSGRAASATGEVVLGSVLARDLHVRVGDHVSLATDGGSGEATVVGLAVFPRFAAYDGAEKTGLGEGVAMTPDEAESLGAQVAPALELLELDRGTDVDAAAHDLDARLTTAAHDLGLPVEAGNASSWKITRPPEPDGLNGYRDLGALPIIFAGLLALVTGGATAHVLISSVRQRRTELGVLRAFGFDRRQVRQSIAWQASATALVALIVGLPLGIVVGRAGWDAFAERIGIVPSVALPVWLAAIVPVVLVLANAVALLPAWRATRAPAAVALRTE